MFSWSVTYLFTPLTLVSSEEQKINFDEIQFINVSMLPFMELAFGFISQKSFPNSRSQRFSDMFSSRNFKVLDFIVQFVIHF